MDRATWKVVLVTMSGGWKIRDGPPLLRPLNQVDMSCRRPMHEPRALPYN